MAGTKPWQPPFVGRESERTALLALARSATEGRGGFALVTGEAGAGKSRLAESLASEASGLGLSVLWGRSFEADAQPSFWPWTQVVRALLARPAGVSAAESLGANAQEIRDLALGGTERVDGGSMPVAARFRQFDALGRFLCYAGDEEPLLVLLDDLHHADEATLQFLRFLSPELGERAVAVVGMAQDVELRAVVGIDELHRLAELSVDLRGWTRREVAQCVASAVAGVDPAVIDEVVDRTNGNPYLVAELARAIAAGGGRRTMNDLPRGVRAMVRTRTAPLPSGARRLLELGAVAGREFEIAIVQSAGVLTSTEIEAGVEAVRRAGLLEVPDAGACRFVHGVVREAILGDLRAADRDRLHGALAGALEQAVRRGRDDLLPAAAVHAARAGGLFPAEKARGLLCDAAGRAQAMLAFEDAARFLRAARALPFDASETAERAERVAILLALADALTSAGDRPAAREVVFEAAGLARAAGLVHELGEAALRYGLGEEDGLTEDPVRVRLLNEAIEANRDREPALEARLLARLAWQQFTGSGIEARESLSRAAVEFARRSEDDSALAYA